MNINRGFINIHKRAETRGRRPGGRAEVVNIHEPSFAYS